MFRGAAECRKLRSRFTVQGMSPMPQRRSRIPNLCHHKPSGRDVVDIGRTAVYLSPHDAADAQQ